jgi:N-acetylmuramoyl-L-alanine amidase
VTDAGGADQASTVTRRALVASGFAAGAALALVPWLAANGNGNGAGRGHGLAARASTGKRAQAVSQAYPPPPIVRRVQWGAQESRRNGEIDYDDVVEKVVVHHTAIDDGTGNWTKQVRDIYEWETATGYRDIAYHFLVDPHGTVYEGRWARDYPAKAVPDGQDGRGRSVRGGHARGHNPRTLGFTLLGDYTRTQPSTAALDALLALLAWKCNRWSIDPVGASPYVNTQAQTQTFANIVGHGQIRPTQCPGLHLDALLADLRARTADRLARPPGDGGA